MVASLLVHQQTAGVVRLMLCSLLTMLTSFSRGCIISFATSGLPKMMEPNKTGILLDIHQISWISKLDYYDIVPNQKVCSVHFQTVSVVAPE